MSFASLNVTMIQMICLTYIGKGNRPMWSSEG